MQKIVIFGAGGGASTALRYFEKDIEFEVVGFTVDRHHMKVDRYLDRPVVPFDVVEKEFSVEDHQLFMLLGFDNLNELRRQKFLEGKEKGYSFASYISQRCDFDKSVSIGENCFILDGQTINFDVTIEDNVVMWSGNHIGDRTTIRSHNWITSHVAIGGDCEVGASSFLGMNCTIAHNVAIAQSNIIGAGTLITQSSKDNEVFVIPGTKASNFDSLQFARLM